MSGLTIREAVLRDARVYYERRLAEAETPEEVARFRQRLASCNRALLGSGAVSMMMH